MRSVLIGFAIGICLLQWQSCLWSPLWYGLMMLPLLLCLVGRVLFPASRRLVGSLLTVLMLCACGAGVGFGWAGWCASRALSDQLPKMLEGQDLLVTATVDSLPFRFPEGVRFNAHIERATDASGKPVQVPEKVALAWYTRAPRDAEAVDEIHPGQRWQWRVRLQRPHASVNPNGFDYEVWLLEQGLRATGTIREETDGMAENRRVNEFVISFNNIVERSRDALRARILAALPDKRYASVIVALVIGDQRQVSQSDWTVFNRTGIGHLISISGTHITMIAWLFAGVAGALWRRSFFTRAALPLRLPVPKFMAVTGFVVALIYVWLAGFGVPAQRTLYMIGVVAFATWSGRLTSVSHIMCIALGLVLLIDPWSVLWPGFWLSFCAVGIILYASVGRMPHRIDPSATRWAKLIARLREEGHTQYVVTLGLVPLSMLLFGQVSVISPVANAVAIPLISMLVAPIALFGSVTPAPLGGALLSVAHALIAGLARVLETLAHPDYAVWSLPVPDPGVFAFAMVGTLWLLAPRGFPLRWCGLLTWLPLLATVPTHPAHGEFALHALDVGQGMAVLIETEHGRLLYDTGPHYSPESDGGNRVIIPYLHARGIAKLDGLVISHNDSDHSGGALTVLEAIPVGWSMTSLALESDIVTHAPAHRRCVAGLHWEWDGVRFEVLQPQASSYDSQKYRPNARSCTVRISNGKHVALLAGDIEAVQEAELLNMNPSALRADILLVPHHGSGTSSTQQFLEAVRPQWAIFQLGYRNRYHHPRPDVYQRYADLGIRRLRSDDEGEIAFHVGDKIEVESCRREARRYWYD